MDQLTQSFIIGIVVGITLCLVAYVLTLAVTSNRGKKYKKPNVIISCDATGFNESMLKAQRHLNKVKQA